MASDRIRKCRVCGKEYEACNAADMPVNAFRWQRVSCSPECGEMYLDLIKESRAPKKKVTKKEAVVNKEPEEVATSEEVESPLFGNYVSFEGI